MPVSVDKIGKVYGYLTVTCKVRRNGRIGWACRCICGAQTVVATCNLATGNSTSCGCKRRDTLISHNKARRIYPEICDGTTEFASWRSILARCKNTNNKYYGGRGITICDDWRCNYESFLSHIGYAPGPKYTVDRIDNEGNYEPGNVRWATQKEQIANSNHEGRRRNASIALKRLHQERPGFNRTKSNKPSAGKEVADGR